MIKPLHIGDVTHHHDQSITSVSLSIENTKNKNFNKFDTLFNFDPDFILYLLFDLILII